MWSHNSSSSPFRRYFADVRSSLKSPEVLLSCEKTQRSWALLTFLTEPLLTLWTGCMLSPEAEALDWLSSTVLGGDVEDLLQCCGSMVVVVVLTLMWAGCCEWRASGSRTGLGNKEEEAAVEDSQHGSSTATRQQHRNTAAAPQQSELGAPATCCRAGRPTELLPLYGRYVTLARSPSPQQDPEPTEE